MGGVRILVLWNHVGEDIYARWKAEGPARLSFDPEDTAVEVESVQEEMDALVAGLREAGYLVECVNAGDDLDRVMAAVRLHQPDLVFNLVEYFNDDEGQESAVAGLYELLGVEYTGNRAPTLITCQNKVRAKLLLSAAGLPTPRSMAVEALPVPRPEDRGLSYPLIVKPALEDASGGIEESSVVQNYAQLVARVRHILDDFEQPALVEEYIDGREIHVALLGDGDPEVLPLFEMQFEDQRIARDGRWRPQIISYSAKWDPTTEEFYSMEAACPAVVEPEVAQRIREVAVAAFRVMECRDYARVDMRVSHDGQPYILEVNPNPDLAVDGAFETCARASGRTYAQTLAAIVESGLRRNPPRQRAAPAPEPRHESEQPTDEMLRRHQRSDADAA